MSLVLFEGFENTPDGRLTYVSGATTASGRNGDGWTLNNDDYIIAPLSDASSNYGAAENRIVGFAIYITVYPGNRDAFVSVGANDSYYDCFELDGSGIITYKTTSTVATASSAVPLNTWTYLEFEWSQHNTTGVAKVWIDGTQVMDYSGDTYYNTTGSTVHIGHFAGTFRSTVDDLYVCDTAGSAPFNARLGDVKVVTLPPTGTGNYAAGVGSDGNSVDNYQLVDEQPASSADYVTLETAADRESYTCANLGAGEVPMAVRVSAWAGDAGGLTTLDPFLRISATDYDAAVSLAVTQSYRWRDAYWETNPNTASAWVEDDLDGVEFGIERVV